MSAVFVCYRREDAAAHAGWLRQSLITGLGKENVFMDVDTIAPGADFDEVIQGTLDATDVMLVVIGPRWIDVRDDEGVRRLDDPDDYVRLEVASGLKRRIRVIPVLVGGARVPKSDQLPEDLKKLTRRQAIELSDTRWSYDTERLISGIRDIQSKVPVSPVKREESAPPVPPVSAPPVLPESARPVPPESAPPVPPESVRPVPPVAPQTGTLRRDPVSHRVKDSQDSFDRTPASTDVSAFLAVALMAAGVGLMLPTYAAIKTNSAVTTSRYALAACMTILCGLGGVVSRHEFRRAGQISTARAATLLVIPPLTLLAAALCLFRLYLPFVARNSMVAAMAGLLLGSCAISNFWSDWRGHGLRSVALWALTTVTWAVCSLVFVIYFDVALSEYGGYLEYIDGPTLQYLWSGGVKVKLLVTILGFAMGGSVGLCLMKGRAA